MASGDDLERSYAGVAHSASSAPSVMMVGELPGIDSKSSEAFIWVLLEAPALLVATKAEERVAPKADTLEADAAAAMAKVSAENFMF
jgi:hypothetical protein